MSATDVVTIATAGDGGFGSPLDVFLSKTTDAPPWGGNMRTEMGHAAEPVIIGELARRHNLTNLVTSPTVRSRILPYFLATPDRLVLDKDGMPLATCEAKLVGARMVPRWLDEDGAIVFPDEVAIQVAWQQLVLRTSDAFEHSYVDRGYLGALLGDIGEDAFHSTVLPWAGAIESMAEGLQVIAQQFWLDHVLTGVPPTPDGSERAREALERMYPGLRRPVLAEASSEACALMVEYVAVRDVGVAADKRKAEIGNQIRAIVGAANVEGIQSATHKCTWKQQAGRVAIDRVIARAGLPVDVVDECRGAPSRVLRVTPLTTKAKAYASTIKGLAE
jgi:hypothetical protein